MSRIFISYRRVDSSGYVVAIYDKLAQKFEAAQIFRDLDTIEPGEDFAQVIEDAVSSCDVLLAIIGPHWLTVSDNSGRRRLDNPNDFVRLEIATALRRNIRIIPVLVGGAYVPHADQLPDDLKALTRRNALEVHDRDFHTHMERLIRALEKALTVVQQTAPSVRAVPEPPLQSTPNLPDVSKILPPPFEWCEIPAGKVTLEAGGYVPEGGETFPVPAFAIAKYPTTNAQFAKFVEAGGYSEKRWWADAGWQARKEGWAWDNKSSSWKATGKAWTEPRYWSDKKWNGADTPVVGVSWYEVMAFCAWLSDTTGENITLPTEQQWQRAAQGDDGRVYPWGNEFDAKRCNSKQSGIGHTTPVTQYPNGASPFGVMDMSGNVWEWCLTPYESGDNRDINNNVTRVLRGGSFNLNNTGVLRAAFRFWNEPTFDFINYGSRCVRL